MSTYTRFHYAERGNDPTPQPAGSHCNQSERDERCSRCNGFGKTTSNAVPCTRCNGTGKEPK